MAAPRYTAEAIASYHAIATQESANDFFVCDLGDTNELTLVETGMGGMQRVREILQEGYQAKTAVAMFRVTAVDDRENTVSYRTKLILVIYTGPKTPVVKRAKVGTFHAAFKQPFTQNLTIQTDDLEDLTEAPIERSLRASGGAHAPSRYDFTNSSAPGSGGGGGGSFRKSSPAAAPAPAVTPPSPVAAKPAVAKPAPVAAAKPTPPPAPVYASTEDVATELALALDSEDVAAALLVFSEDSEVVHTDATEKATRSYKGLEDIKSFYTWWFERLAGAKTSETSNEVNGPAARSEWEAVDAGYAYGSTTSFVSQGKVLLLTLVTVDVAQDEGEELHGEVEVEDHDQADEEQE